MDKKRKHLAIEVEPIDMGDRVEIKWFDAHGGGGWMPAAEIGTVPHDIVSFGAVFENTEHAVTIVQSVDMDSGGIDQYICIPWVNVKTVTVL